MKILYHVTPRRNLQSIEEHGLIPVFQKGLTCGSHTFVKPVIWLTDDPDHILTTQAGENWIKHHNPVVLRVDCNGLAVKKYISNAAGTSIIVPHEYYVEHSIKQRFGVK